MKRFWRILTRWRRKAANHARLLHLVCAVITFEHSAYWDRLKAAVPTSKG
jgi:hypothetical protein